MKRVRVLSTRRMTTANWTLHGQPSWWGRLENGEPLTIPPTPAHTILNAEVIVPDFVRQVFIGCGPDPVKGVRERVLCSPSGLAFVERIGLNLHDMSRAYEISVRPGGQSHDEARFVAAQGSAVRCIRCGACIEGLSSLGPLLGKPDAVVPTLCIVCVRELEMADRLSVPPELLNLAKDEGGRWWFHRNTRPVAMKKVRAL